MEPIFKEPALSMDKFNKCGELYRSPLINDKQYMFLSCIHCKTISWDLDTFLKHLDNTHHKLDIVYSNLFKEEEINEDNMTNIANNMETGILQHIQPNESLLAYVANDPLDENHCDYVGISPESIKMEKNYSNVCDINIKAEIKILNKDIVHTDEEWEGENSYDEDNELDGNSPENANESNTADNSNEEHHEEDDSDVSDEENKKNTNIKYFTKNRNFIKCLITAYQKQNMLWDRNKNSSTVAKNEALLRILREINEKFQITASLQQIKRIIKHLKFRFIQHLRLREKGEANKTLWFFEMLRFLEPHLKETKIKTGICTQLNDAEFLALIKLLKENECFWNENNIYHTSVIKKQEVLILITKNFSKICHIKDLNIDIMQNTLEEIILMAREENACKMQRKETDKKSEEYLSSKKFLKEMEFLLPHVGPFQCKYCPKKFVDIYAFKFHRSKHEGTKPFKCMQCSRELTHKKEFVCHLRRHTNECPFQCNTCDKSFPSQKEWHRHVIKHGSKPYVCELCADSFYTQHQLTNHMKNHNNIRDHVCPECGKGFTHRGLLRQHLQTHNKTKCYCTLCDNIYSNPRSLRKHYVKVHESGQEPSNALLAQYKCQICKITFSSIQDAKQHRKEHKQSNPSERKHVCDVCGHHFAYPRNLADHKKTHSNIRDQVCDVCGKAFTNANLLNQHKNVHTGEKFVCKACGKDYAHYRGLCRHITKVHGTNIRDLDAILEKQKSDKSLQ